MCSLLRIAVTSGGVPAHARISDADKAAVFHSDGELSTDEWLGCPHGELGRTRGARGTNGPGEQGYQQDQSTGGHRAPRGSEGPLRAGRRGLPGVRPGRGLRPGLRRLRQRVRLRQPRSGLRLRARTRLRPAARVRAGNGQGQQPASGLAPGSGPSCRNHSERRSACDRPGPAAPAGCPRPGSFGRRGLRRVPNRPAPWIRPPRVTLVRYQRSAGLPARRVTPLGSTGFRPPAAAGYGADRDYAPAPIDTRLSVVRGQVTARKGPAANRVTPSRHRPRAVSCPPVSATRISRSRIRTTRRRYIRRRLRPARLPQSGYPQSGYSQSGYSQSGYPQSGYSSPATPSPAIPSPATPSRLPAVRATGESGYPESGYSQSDHPEPGFPQSGFPESDTGGSPFGEPDHPVTLSPGTRSPVPPSPAFLRAASGSRAPGRTSPATDSARHRPGSEPLAPVRTRRTATARAPTPKMVTPRLATTRTGTARPATLRALSASPQRHPQLPAGPAIRRRPTVRAATVRIPMPRRASSRPAGRLTATMISPRAVVRHGRACPGRAAGPGPGFAASARQYPDDPVSSGVRHRRGPDRAARPAPDEERREQPGRRLLHANRADHGHGGRRWLQL
jgi:hypothetical protein